MGEQSYSAQVLCFQDLVARGLVEESSSELQQQQQQQQKENEQEEDSQYFSNIFFELANTEYVGYRIPVVPNNNDDNDDNHHHYGSAESSKIVTIRQDSSACENHTGGIVWETSYLLLNWLLQQHKSLGKVLDIGAGCGMLGLGLAASGLSNQVVLTEAAEVMQNLRANVKANMQRSIKKKNKRHASKQQMLPPPACPEGSAVARQLRWDHLQEDVLTPQVERGSGMNNDSSLSEKTMSLLCPHSFQTIVGTDVIFSPPLVEPLLNTLHLMSNCTTNIYLCLQVRCSDSHARLLELAPKMGFLIKDVTERELTTTPNCSWGLELECKLLHLTIPHHSETPGIIGKKRQKEGRIKRKKPKADDKEESYEQKKQSKEKKKRKKRKK